MQWIDKLRARAADDDFRQGVRDMASPSLGLAAWGLFGAPMIGLVIGLALILTLVVAALAGVLVPLALNRLGFDPALSSGTFVITLTDVIGFLAFLGLATVMLT